MKTVHTVFSGEQVAILEEIIEVLICRIEILEGKQDNDY